MKAMLWSAVALFVIMTGAAEGTFRSYLALHDTTLTDECPVCGRPTIPMPVRGRFEAAFDSELNVISLTNIFLTNATHSIRGHGEVRIDLRTSSQKVELWMEVSDGTKKESLVLTNEAMALTRNWPMINFRASEETSSLARVYHLDVSAAPVEEIWFSPTTGFTPDAPGHEGERVMDGDIISMGGRVVKRESQLTSSLDLEDPFTPVGIDAFAVGVGGELLFSLATKSSSLTAGAIQEGDLLSLPGGRKTTNQELLAGFGPVSAEDAGLDAIALASDGTMLFSTRMDVPQQGGGVLNHGDVLSSTGQIIRASMELFTLFLPDIPNPGVDAFYFWPHGEIWFSTSFGFNSALHGPIGSGDLLSDAGYVVFQNLEMVGAFAPREDVSQFGLDALQVLPNLDFSGPGPRLTHMNIINGEIFLEWTAAGRTFQVEAAEEVSGPYTALSPIITELTWWVGRPSINRRFFRVRAWP